VSLPDILFKGVPRQYTRGYTAAVIREVRPDRVFIPCVGAFALASTTAHAGIDPSKIEACDISLYSSVIGAMLSETDIHVRPTPAWDWLAPYMTDDVGKVAAVTVAIRILQYEAKRQSLFIEHRKRELVSRAESYIEQGRKAAERIMALLGGMQYQPEDMWTLIDRALAHDDPEKVLILCNPPRYTGGYDRMYDGVERAFTWDAPTVAQFDETQYRRLIDRLATGPSALVYYATPVRTGEDPAAEWGLPWRSVFAARPKDGATAAINWIVSNRPMQGQFKRVDVEKPTKARYKMFREGVIRPDSELRVVREKAETVNYYRDLLVHRLGLVSAERYQVLLLDGKLLACLGFHVASLRTGKTGADRTAHLTFAFSATHSQYERLHKLTLMTCCSSWLWAEEMSDVEDMPTQLATTMLTPFPEAKTARGIFRLLDRERQNNGEYKLKYSAQIVQRTAAETLTEWMRRWG
jgi:hypothetical protein